MIPVNISLISLLILTNIKQSASMDIELVFHLQVIFQSDLILIAKTERNDDFVKKFFKLENIPKRGFIGVIDVHKNFEKFIEKEYISPYRNAIIFTDGKNDIIKKLMSIKNLTMNLMASVVWVNYIEGSVTDLLKEIYIPFNNKFLIVKKINNLRYEISDVYQISKYSSKIFSRFALWKNKKLTIFENDFFAKRMNLKGHELTIAKSPVKLTAEQDDYLWKLFSERMNFSINWVPTIGGIFHPNGTKTGLFKDIYDGDVDGSPSLVLLSKNRMDVFDYFFPTAIAETKLFVKQSIGLNWDSYLEPFSNNVWLTILLWIISASVIIEIIFRCNQYITTRNEISFFYILKALCYQGSSLKPSSSSLFISYLIPYILAVILIQYYSGALLSYLSMHESNIRFKNLEEVVQDGRYKISVVKGNYEEFYFNTDPGPVATAARDKKLLVESDKLPPDTPTAFRQICENKWIFLCEINGEVIQPNCDVVEIKKAVFVDNVGILIWKGFPYKEVMSKIMKRVQFAGLAKLKKKTILIPNEEIQPFEPFGMDLVFPIFSLYLIFIIFSFIIYFCEVSWKRKRIKKWSRNARAFQIRNKRLGISLRSEKLNSWLN